MSIEATDPITLTCGPIGDIAVDPAGSTVVLTHPRDRAVSVLDVDHPAAASFITLDGDPTAVAVAAGRIFVATTSASYDSIYVLDVHTQDLVSVHPLEFTITSMAVTPDGARVFAARTGRLGNDVAVVDVATEAVTPLAIAAGDSAIIDAVRPGAGGLLYAGISSPYNGELVVIDATQGRVVATVQVGAPVRDVALSPDAAAVYVLAHHPRGGAAVIRIDAASNAIDAVIEVRPSATQVAVSPNGAAVYVVEPYDVAVICAVTGKVFARITVGAWLSSVAASSATGRLYVADYAGVLTGLPAVAPAPATPPLEDSLQAVIADPVPELESVAV